MLEKARLSRPISFWVVEVVCNITFFTNKFKEHPIGCEISLPNFIVNNAELNALQKNKKSGRLQRWIRGHKARGQGQGHKKNPRPRSRTAFRGQTLSRPRTGMLEAKAKDQGHKRKCSPKKKKVFTKIFQAISTKNVFQKIFQALHKIFTIQKIVLSSSRGQANFRGLEASRPRPRT